mgnify:CR=1 FL=1
MKSKPAPAKKAPAKTPAKPSPRISNTTGMDAKWQAEDDARTLLRAEEIKADKARVGKAKAVVAKQAQAAQKVIKS